MIWGPRSMPLNLSHSELPQYPLPMIRAPRSLDRDTDGCTKTRHLRCDCGLRRYCCCNDCTRTKVLGKASNPSSGHHFNQDLWTKYLICKEYVPWPTDLVAGHCHKAAYGPLPFVTRSRCCGAALRRRHSLQLRNSAIVTFTDCGQSKISLHYIEFLH